MEKEQVQQLTDVQGNTDENTPDLREIIVDVYNRIKFLEECSHGGLALTECAADGLEFILKGITKDLGDAILEYF